MLVVLALIDVVMVSKLLILGAAKAGPCPERQLRLLLAGPVRSSIIRA